MAHNLLKLVLTAMEWMNKQSGQGSGPTPVGMQYNRTNALSPSFEIERKWHQDCHCSWCALKFFNVSRQLVEGTFKLQTQRRRASNLQKFPVYFLHPRCQVTCWSSRGFFLAVEGTESRARYDRQMFDICNTWPDRRRKLNLKRYGILLQNDTKYSISNFRNTHTTSASNVSAVTQTPCPTTEQQNWGHCDTVHATIKSSGMSGRQQKCFNPAYTTRVSDVDVLLSQTRHQVRD